MLAQVASSGFDLLPNTGDHAGAVGRLPHHHDDLFDRFADYGVGLIAGFVFATALAAQDWCYPGRASLR